MAIQIASEKRTTLEDIARAVGVSRASVGKVLGSNKSNIRVSVEKAKVIRQKAMELHYSPNINARALAGQTTQVIGVLMDSKAPGVFLQRAAAIERVAYRHGYRTMIGEAHDDVENFYNTYQHMCQHGVDGILFVSHDYPWKNQQIDQFFAKTGPMVFLGGPERRGHSQVILEVDSGIKQAVDHLRQRGRHNIMLLSNTDSKYWSVKTREKGFTDAFPEAEKGTIQLFKQSDNIEEMRANVRQLIHDVLIPGGIDGILTPNDLVALLLEGELLSAGLTIPGDIALVGFDNEPFSACAQIPITTIDQNNGSIAEYAIRMLLDIIQDQNSCHVARKISVQPELVIRKTS